MSCCSQKNTAAPWQVGKGGLTGFESFPWMDSKWDDWTGHGEQPRPANGSERQRHRSAVGTPYVGGMYVGIRNDWLGLQLISTPIDVGSFCLTSTPLPSSSHLSITKVLTPQ